MLLVHTAIQTKSKKNKGIDMCLKQLGDPKEIYEKYNAQIQKLNEIPKEFQEVSQNISRNQDNINYQREPQEQLQDQQEQSQLNNISAQEQQQINTNNYLQRMRQLREQKQQKPVVKQVRISQPDEKVLKEINQVHKNLVQKQEIEKNEKEQEKNKIIRQKKNLRAQLQQRSIQHGISFLNQPDYTPTLLFEFGSKESKIQNSHGLPELQYFDLKDEEDRDQTMINQLLNKYKKVLKLLFVKYSNSAGAIVKSANFDQLQQKLKQISLAELWKLLKDHNLTQYISQADHKALIRIVNTHKDNYNLKNLSYNFYLDYLVQFSLLTFGRQEKFKYRPISDCFLEMIMMMRDEFKQQGQSVQMFDDPNATSLFEGQIIKEFQKILQQDPNYILPNGYKSTKINVLQFEYAWKKQKEQREFQSQQKNVRDSQVVLYDEEFAGQVKNQKSQKRQITFENYVQMFELVNDIFNNAIGTKIIEAYTYSIQEIQVVRQINPGMVVQNHFMDWYKDKDKMRISMSQQEKRQVYLAPPVFGQQQKYTNKRVLPIENYHNLDLNLKLEISKFPYNERFQVEQIAFCIDDIVRQVEHGKTELRQVQENLYFKKKRIQEEAKSCVLQEQNQKIKLRHNQLKTQMKNIKRKQSEDLKLKQQIISEKRTEQEKQNKLRKQKQSIINQNNRQQIKEFKEQQNKELEQQQEQYKKQQLNFKEKQKKEFNQFNQKQIEKINQEQQKRRESEIKQQKLYKLNNEVKQQKAKILHVVIQQKDQQNLEKEQKNNNLIQYFHTDPATQNVYKQNSYVLRQLFEFLLKNNVTISQEYAQNEISLRQLQYMSYKFDLYPGLISANDTALIFRSLTKNKNLQDKKKPGLNYLEFLQFITRTCIKGAQKLNIYEDILEKSKQGNFEIGQTNEISNYIMDEYEDIDNIKVQTIQKFINWLKLPTDKLALIERFKQIKEKSSKDDNLQFKKINQIINLGKSKIRERNTSATKKSQIHSNLQKQGSSLQLPKQLQQQENQEQQNTQNEIQEKELEEIQKQQSNFEQNQQEEQKQEQEYQKVGQEENYEQNKQQQENNITQQEQQKVELEEDYDQEKQQENNVNEIFKQQDIQYTEPQILQDTVEETMKEVVQDDM